MSILLRFWFILTRTLIPQVNSAWYFYKTDPTVIEISTHNTITYYE